LSLIAALPPSQRAAAVQQLLQSPGVTSLIQADAAALVAQGLMASQPQGAKQIQQALHKLATDVVMV
jgi:Tfp pilus assembly ATPase PilU